MNNALSVLLSGLFLAGVMNAPAMADTTGTQTFTAAIPADTCVINNLNQTIDLGNLPKDQIVNGYSPFHVTFDVTGCDKAITSMTAQLVAPTTYGIISNGGTASNISLYFKAGNNTRIDHMRGNGNLGQGSTAITPVVNGNGSLDLKGIFELPNAKLPVQPGTLQFSPAFVFDFS
ncbi:P pilus assembly protein, pilin FimA [Citrobacter freundii]|nr:P pilus assembly protein, pilin FimA [Citrobacter freundii]